MKRFPMLILFILAWLIESFLIKAGYILFAVPSERLAKLRKAFVNGGSGGRKIDEAKLDEIGNMLITQVNSGKKFSVNTVAEYIAEKWDNLYKDEEGKLKKGAIKTAARKALISLGVIEKKA